MDILFSAIHLINYEEEKVVLKNATSDFESFVKDLSEFANNNESIRYYKEDSPSFVADTIKDIIGDCDLNEDGFKKYTQEIALKLLCVEMEVQDLLDRWNKKVKKGNLIQVLYKENGNYRYLLAKVESDKFMEDETLIFKSGFSTRKNDIFRTCIMRFAMDESDNPVFDIAKVYMDTDIKYWPQTFLQLIEQTNDETNTREAYGNIEHLLKRRLKKSHPRDYAIISNTFTNCFMKKQLFDVNKITTDILAGYTGVTLSSKDTNKLKDDILDLPKLKKFDQQFTSVPSAIQRKVRKILPVNSFVDLRITPGINLDAAIESFQDELTKTRYIKIKIDNEETYKMFLKKDSV